MSFAGRALLRFNQWRECRDYKNLLWNGDAVYRQKQIDDEGRRDAIIQDLRFRDGPTFRVRDGAGAAHVFYEIFLRDLYPKRLLQGAKTIVDVGANIGLFSYYARRHAPSARILAIEADPATFEVMNGNLVDQNVERFYQAVASVAGTIDFYSSSTSGWSSLYPVMGAADGKKVSVKAEPLSVTLERCGVTEIDFLKVDVEGAEYDILLADPKLWRTPIKNMVVEVDRTPRDGRHMFDELISQLRMKFKTVDLGSGKYPLVTCSS